MQAEVTVSGYTYIGKPFNTKVYAENSAAATAISYLEISGQTTDQPKRKVFHQGFNNTAKRKKSRSRQKRKKRKEVSVEEASEEETSVEEVSVEEASVKDILGFTPLSKDEAIMSMLKHKSQSKLPTFHKAAGVIPWARAPDGKVFILLVN